ncbi:SusC/RagA family TonB-linked outer membrane protein [Flavobacterium psychrotolerans]|uniref:TonB-dependent receptor n=1 Tax=Flavobacterium psychrotolerans TaxID=2169410 RepID=A0A2U1JG16_9FLAO|nr:TonB-dependent receptor [Flavobacterium psychrotolerans]PWA03975.1 TonB-dependent receptor [Flavobacterium psychrotolerans]
MKFKNYLGLLFLFIVSVVNAQTIEIKGKVSDSKTKSSIPGANVLVKSSKKGVATDFDGNYIIKANANDVLVFSNVSYASKEVKVEKSQTLNISLSEEANKLEEVVINVGYGTQKKKNITNAISSVKSEAFDDRPLFNVGQALQGNAAGVNVIQPSGKPGVGLDIRIRGLSSINSGNNPIFVIDGVQTYDSSGISTDDIVDIQILKDATATAIYGVNGSAGVVLITTKRGKANKNVFSFSSYFGTSKIVKNIDVLNSDQYRTLMGEISSGYVGYIDDPKYAGINTNWRDLVFQTGEDKNYDLSYSGGTEKIKAFASLGYQDTKGIVKPSNFSRLSGRINIDVDAATWLKAHANMNLIHTNLNNTSDNNSANQGGVILSTLTTPAFLPVYADNLVGGSVAGGQLDGQFAANPVASLENPVAFQSRQEDNKTSRYLANLGLDITLAKNLIWKPSSSVDVYRSVYDYFVDSFRSNYGRGEADATPDKKGIGREHTARSYNWNLENTLNYTIKSGDHDFAFLIGNSIQKQRYDQLKIEGTGFAPDLRKLDISQMMLINRQSSDTIAREKNYVSYFGRATYNYKGKYILNGVFRASGASQLAEGHKWGYFPGVSAAWIISNEEFLKSSSSISELKLRGGWGQAGNISGVSDYSSFGLLGDDHGTVQNYKNIELTWETTTDLNVGLDIGILNNRVRLTADAFQKTTHNLFNDIRISNVPYYYNGGELQNKGLEFALNTVNFKGDFSWNTNFNISFIKNEVVEMGKYRAIVDYGYQGVNRVEKGSSLGDFYGYVVDQVNPTTGILEYKDLNGDGKVNTNDRTVIGNALPDYTFGMTNTFSYNGFSLDVLVTGSQGNDIFNASRIDLEGMIDNKNQSVAVLDRWTTVGQITDVPMAGPTQFQGIGATANSTRWIEDGSYVRIKAATLGYNFKKLFLGLNSLKLYATGQNLVTWTNYSGFDPEVSAFSGNTGTGQGIDYGTYPQVRTFIFGVKAGF